MLRALALLLCAAIGFLIGGEARAQTGLTVYYCSAYDPGSDTLYLSPTRAVGPIAERSGYGPRFLGELSGRGVGADATVRCTMRLTQAEIDRGREAARRDCRECNANTRVVALTGGVAPIPSGRVPVRSTLSNPGESIRRSLSENNPGTCLVDRAGGVRCSGGVQNGKPLPGFVVEPAPRDVPVIPAQTFGRATLCQKKVQGRCLDKPVATPKPLPGSDGSETTYRPRPVPRPASPQAPPKPSKKPKPEPTPPPQLRTACSTMDAYGYAEKSTITLQWPEIQVQVQGQITLFLKNIYTGAEYTLGYGRYSIPVGTYRLSANGWAGGIAPYQFKITACATYRVS
ncbi:MAG: hypothetical protein V4659_01990 [Pseudomonadota bacterium]